MPRPRVSRNWADSVRFLTENDPHISAAKIRQTLTAAASARPEWGAVPSLRWIGERRSEHLRSPEATRVRYREFRWPEAMTTGMLPWESARSIFELVRYFSEMSGPPLTLRRAVWFWRVSLAAPTDAPVDELNYCAWCCLIAEDVPEAEQRSIHQHVHARLVRMPWPSGTQRANEFVQAVNRGDVVALPNYLGSHKPSDPIVFVDWDGRFFRSMNARRQP